MDKPKDSCKAGVWPKLLLLPVALLSTLPFPEPPGWSQVPICRLSLTSRYRLGSVLLRQLQAPICLKLCPSHLLAAGCLLRLDQVQRLASLVPASQPMTRGMQRQSTQATSRCLDLSNFIL